jgi:arsenite oxidase small subunit
MSSSGQEKTEPVEGKRSFLRTLLAAGAIATIASAVSGLRALVYVPSTTSGTSGTATLSWPKLKLINAASLEPLKPLRFNYPLTDTQNFLVKLGMKAENGVGPDSDIVAFSEICQHLGCYYGFEPTGASPPCNSLYKASVPMGYCCCHGSQYDFTHSARVIGGPAPRPLPQVILEYDQKTHDIYVVGMEPPNIYGHGPQGSTNPEDVLRYDLEGGQVVTQDTLSVVQAS